MPPVEFEPTVMHYQLLFSADSTTFLELRSGLKTYGFPEDYEWPEIPLREAKLALLELVDAGLVEVLGDRAEPLAKAKARSEIERDSTWEAKSPDAPDYYEVTLADAGVMALKALRATFSHIGRVVRHN